MKEILFKLFMLIFFFSLIAFAALRDIHYIKETNDTKNWQPRDAQVIGTGIKKVDTGKHTLECAVIFIAVVESPAINRRGYLETQDNCSDAHAQLMHYPVKSFIRVLVNPKSAFQFRSINFPNRHLSYWGILFYMGTVGFFIWLLRIDSWELYHKSKRDRMFR